MRAIFNDMTVHPKIKNEIRQIHQLISTTNEERVLLNAALIFYDIKEFPICMKTMLDAVPYRICHRLIFIQLSIKGYHNSFIHICRILVLWYPRLIICHFFMLIFMLKDIL